MRSKSNLFKNKKKIRKFSKKGGKKYTGFKMFQTSTPFIIDWDDDNDFEGFKKKFTEDLDEKLSKGATEVTFKVMHNSPDNANNLSEFINDKFYFTNADNKIKTHEPILIGNCAMPHYPGSHKKNINLTEIIEKIKEYTQLHNINSIELYIGGSESGSAPSEPCIRIYAYSILEIIGESIWYDEFPLNIPADISSSEDPYTKKLYKFLKDLSSIVLSEKGEGIKWKVTNNICCTCFPIFEFLKYYLNFEYKRLPGQGCGWCKDLCEYFGTTCVRPELIRAYNKLPKFK
jgi:hypothetical protein